MKRIKLCTAVIACLAFGMLTFPVFGTSGDTVSSIVRGTDYLRRIVAADQYHLACRASDGSSCPVHRAGHVFAGFFIALAIGDSLSPAERQKIISRMDAEERQGVWGYMHGAPVDSDDTAFVIRTYRMLGQDRAADSLLSFYNKEARAFTTFGNPGRASFVDEASTAGNFGIHPEVNANIFTLLTDTKLSALINEDLLVRAQTPQGWWRSYFYPGRYYGTYMNLNFLSRTGRGRDAIEKSLVFLRISQNADGSWGGTYETSLALNALADCGVFDASFSRGISWLALQQKPDGSWRDENVPLWEYTYRDDPPIIWRAYDTGGVVTTALAVVSLRAAQKAGLEDVHRKAGKP